MMLIISQETPFRNGRNKIYILGAIQNVKFAKKASSKIQG